MKEPIIIVGAPRSGTTALMRLMAQWQPDYLPLKEHEKPWQGNKAPSLRDYYARQLKGTGKQGVIDKNVRNSFRVLEIQRQFPRARFVHIIRDGRAAISSWRDWALKTRKADHTIGAAALQWVSYVNYLLVVRTKLNHYEEVRYEDLCAEEESFQSCNYKWLTRLTEIEQRRVQLVAGLLLEDLGYA